MKLCSTPCTRAIHGSLNWYCSAEGFLSIFSCLLTCLSVLFVHRSPPPVGLLAWGTAPSPKKIGKAVYGWLNVALQFFPRVKARCAGSLNASSHRVVPSCSNPTSSDHTQDSQYTRSSTPCFYPCVFHSERAWDISVQRVVIHTQVTQAYAVFPVFSPYKAGS